MSTAPDRSGVPLWRRIGIWLLGILLALDVMAIIFALSAFQVTTESEAKLALRHAIAGLTEIDGLLDEHYPGLRDEAATAQEPLGLPPYPIAIEFTPEEITGSSQESFRELLLDRSVERVYADGPDAFTRDTSGDDGGLLSTRRAVNASLDVFAEGAHRATVVALIVSVALALALIAGLALATPSGVILGSGVAVLSGAGLALLASLGTHVLVSTSDGGYLAEQFVDLVRGLLWAPVRTSAVLFGLGIVATIAGVIVSRRWPLLPSRTATA